MRLSMPLSVYSSTGMVAVVLALAGCADDGVPTDQRGLPWQAEPLKLQAWRDIDTHFTT
jgi:hypothetical protein